jgi:hypothetical protein
MHAVVDKENLSCEEEEEIDKNEKEETLENGDSQFEVVSDQEGSGFSKLVDKSARKMTYSVDYYKVNGSDYDSYSAVMTSLINNDLPVVKHVLRTNMWLPNHTCRETLWMQICKYLHKAGGDVYSELETDLLGGRKYA